MRVNYTFYEYGRATRSNEVSFDIDADVFREIVDGCDDREEAEEAIRDYLCNYEWDNVDSDEIYDFECDDTEHEDNFDSAVDDLMNEFWVEPEEESSEEPDDSLPEGEIVL